MKRLITVLLIVAMLMAMAAPALASTIYSTGSANIRSGPGLDYSKIGAVKKGASLKYLGSTSTDERGVKWYKVSYKGKKGWISSKYSSSKKSSSSSKGKVTSTGQVNLRSGPGLGYKVIGTIDKGTKLTYLGETSTDSRGVKWYRVSYDGNTAWISSKYSKNGSSSGSSSGSKSSSSSKAGKTTKVSGNSVKASAGVNVRSGPGVGYKKIGTLGKGASVKFLGSATTDANGVKWYKVSYNGKTGYVSSRYAKVSSAKASSSTKSSKSASTSNTSDSSSASAASTDSTTVPNLTEDFTSVLEKPEAVTAAPQDYVEVSGFYNTQLVSAAMMLQIVDFMKVQSEVPNQYYNDNLTIAGNENVEYIRVNGKGYTLYGVCVGMDIETAKQLLTAAGLKQNENNLIIGFEHPATATSAVNVDGFDSCINVYTDQFGLVSELDWSTYTSGNNG